MTDQQPKDKEMKKSTAAALLLAVAALSMGCSGFLPSPSSLANMLRPGTSETTISGIVGTVAEELANGDFLFTLCRSAAKRSLDDLCENSLPVTVPRILKDEVVAARRLDAGQFVTVTGDGDLNALEARSVKPGKSPGD